eukprot:s6084_g3.t1
MDAFDGDGEWTYDPDLVCNVLALEVNGRKEDVEVVIDSGADVSVAPIWLAKSGTKVARTGVVMQDAQGNRIPEVQTRLLDIQVPTVEGDSVLIREKFSIARISSVILSLGRLLRSGWELGGGANGPILSRGRHQVPIRLRRNTLTVLATVSMVVAAAGIENSDFAQALAPPRQVNMLTFDDLGPLPKEAKDCARRPG